MFVLNRKGDTTPPPRPASTNFHVLWCYYRVCCGFRRVRWGFAAATWQNAEGEQDRQRRSVRTRRPEGDSADEKQMRGPALAEIKPPDEEVAPLASSSDETKVQADDLKLAFRFAFWLFLQNAT